MATYLDQNEVNTILNSLNIQAFNNTDNSILTYRTNSSFNIEYSNLDQKYLDNTNIIRLYKNFSDVPLINKRSDNLLSAITVTESPNSYNYINATNLNINSFQISINITRKSAQVATNEVICIQLVKVLSYSKSTAPKYNDIYISNDDDSSPDTIDFTKTDPSIKNQIVYNKCIPLNVRNPYYSSVDTFYVNNNPLMIYKPKGSNNINMDIVYGNYYLIAYRPIYNNVVLLKNKYLETDEDSRKYILDNYSMDVSNNYKVSVGIRFIGKKKS